MKDEKIELLGFEEFYDEKKINEYLRNGGRQK